MKGINGSIYMQGPPPTLPVRTQSQACPLDKRTVAFSVGSAPSQGDRRAGEPRSFPNSATQPAWPSQKLSEHIPSSCTSLSQRNDLPL